MALTEIVKSEASLSAERTFCDAIPIEGQFNVLVAGTFVGTLSLQKKHASDPDIEGTATGTAADKLVDSSRTFVTDGVRAGDWVHNLTDNTHAMITEVDSQIQLSINGNIMAVGEEYVIERWWDLPSSGEITAAADKQLEEVEGGVKYRIGFKDGAFTSGSALVRISK